MGKLTFYFRRHCGAVFLLALMLLVIGPGCGRKKAAAGANPVEVNAMQVIQKDTPVTYEFVGTVTAENEVQVRAKVSGNITQKMIVGGAVVYKGQSLFQIDRRDYQAALLNAKAQLAQSQAALSQASLDLGRYRQLAAQGLVPQQTLDDAISLELEDKALVEANQARVEQAEADLQDTLITAPFAGKIDVNELNVGNFVNAGQSTLATLSSVNPVFVQFSISENEYLRFVELKRGAAPAEWFGSLRLVLGDNSSYPLTGSVKEVDRSLAPGTGTLTVKALFANPRNILVPGMFARVLAQGEVRKNALLVPKRALQQLLNKTFLTVVGRGNKAELRPVTIGPQIGNDVLIIESGLNPGETVVVDGFQKVQPGMPLKIKMILAEKS